MGVRIATTDDELRRAWPVMQELRPSIAGEAEFIERVRRMERNYGFHIAYLERDGEVQAVAGFRTDEMLCRGRYLYVDDLVTRAAARSEGHGKAMLDWLTARARQEGCTQLALDSMMDRVDAYRFYGREGMTKFATHFIKDLA